MSVLRRSFIIAGRHLFYTLSISVIIAMLVIAGIVWLSAAVTERKDDIASWASEQLGYEVSIGSAGLYWLDLFPQLQLQQVTVLQDNGQTAMLSAETLHLELDLLATLDTRSPVLSAVAANGLKTEIRRSADNRLTLAGQRSSGFMFELEDVLERLDRITLETAVIAYRDGLYPVLNGQYDIHQATLSRDREHWQSQLTASPPTEVAERLAFDMRLTLAEASQLVGAEGRLAVRDLQLAGLQQMALLDLPFTTDSGQLDLETQLSWQPERSQGEADIAVSNLSLRSPDTADTLPLTALQGRLQWQHERQDWQLAGRQLQIQSEDGDWPQTAFTLESETAGQWLVSGNYLQLSDLHSFAVLFPGLPRWLVELQTAGQVHDYRLAYDQRRGLQSLTAAVEQLTTEPVESIPGVADLSFDIDWQPDVADIRLHAQDWQLFAPQWLPESLWFESASGELQFRKNTDGWRASASDVRVLNDDLGLFLDGWLQQSEEQKRADIALQLDDMRVSRWLNYLPGKLLDPAFLQWSRQAFQKGIAESMTLEFNGNPAEFPFENAQAGSFSAEMQLRDATLKYAPDWPALTAVDARLTATGNQLQIETDRGQTAGFEFTDVSAVIDRVFDGRPQLRVDGALAGSSAAALAFLQESPLRSRYGKVTDWLSVDGRSDIELQLAVPLLSPGETEVTGSVGFTDSQLTLKAAPAAPVNAVSGRLHFSNDGIVAENLQGEFLQRPASVTIAPVDGSTRITASGQLPAGQAGRLWQGQTPGFVSGETDFNATIDVSELSPGEFSFAAALSSDLDGLALALPAPLGKTAQQRRQLTFELQPGDSGQATMYARLADVAQLVHQTGLQSRTVLALGQANAALPDAGFAARADLDELDLDAWQRWYQQYDAGTRMTENVYLPEHLSAQVDRLTFRNQAFADFALQAERMHNDWLLEMTGPQLAGRVHLPADSEQAIDIDLTRLYWQLPEREQDSDTKTGDGTSAERAALWPAMDVHIDDLRVDEMKLGTLQMAASREGLGWVLNSASLESEVLQATAEGRWQQFETGDNSRVRITVNSDDLAGLLTDLQYQPVIEADDTQVDLNVEWPADPLGFSRDSMQGNMTVSTGRGQLREVEPGAAGRVFGLLSFTAIPRRLSLDFSDLFDEGMTFNSINGRFDFDNGQARTDNLQLRSQSAVINIQGPVDLVDETYDQIVQVTPSVSSTLPLAGAVAGGPVGLGVGTAIMLADRLVARVFDREIVDFISYRYRLSGPWKDPQMALITSNDE